MSYRLNSEKWTQGLYLKNEIRGPGFFASDEDSKVTIEKGWTPVHPFSIQTV